MNEFTKKMLQMEDIVERMMEIDKRLSDEVGADVEQKVGGRCTSCNKVYPPDYQQNGDCIPCWREKNNHPKIDTEVNF
ncbi:hypothetical protein NP511_18075 [Natrinema thermotolerans]|uniref:Uncharacterized protein n=1 Tax=Natrinema thermotolerans TaxID=121872 RepID=A0AAF0PD62_9EURY|nr:hypothetical protein [Natrinema thermotolerans]QCC60265.1 hypothetical protein DVR14_17145 [Natrinema thermotolerans]QCC61176.1 hypothetical protein DVR14_21275 [Natrinema thermotolerans]WMT07284.1 hypothetical protein NP511_18075 [Natrinema thermotolerans]